MKSGHDVLTRSGNLLLYDRLIEGLERKSFDNKTVSYERHIKEEHNMWHYLAFIVLVKVKDPTEFTGPESYVSNQVKVGGATLSYQVPIGASLVKLNVSYRFPCLVVVLVMRTCRASGTGDSDVGLLCIVVNINFF